MKLYKIDTAEKYIQQLFENCQTVIENSHSPYSNFPVSASLLTDDDIFINAVNVENASLGLTMCAERNVLFKAISMGKKEFKALGIFAPKVKTMAAPCGACLQVMEELFSPDKPVIIFNANNQYLIEDLRYFLPHPFDKLDLII